MNDSGVQPVRLPPSSPNLNAFAERFVASIRRECLDKLVIFGEQHLRQVVVEFAAHYHGERNHQGLDNELILKGSEPANDNGKIQCRERVGGLLKYYYREAS